MAATSKNTKDEDVVVKDIYSRVRIAQPETIKDSRTKIGKHEAQEITDPEKRFNDLCESCSYLSDKDLKTLKKAYEYADEKHSSQVRKSGEKFIVHPIEVAIILADLNMDIDTLCAALLHDVIEDTDASDADVKKLFNKDVLMLVEGVTKITQIEVGSVSESQAMTLRKMFVAMSNDLRVIVIKLADRLHNMRTLYALKEDRQIFKANETLEIFAPIAHRLGIDSIK